MIKTEAVGGLSFCFKIFKSIGWFLMLQCCWNSLVYVWSTLIRPLRILIVNSSFAYTSSTSRWPFRGRSSFRFQQVYLYFGCLCAHACVCVCHNRLSTDALWWRTIFRWPPSCCRRWSLWCRAAASRWRCRRRCRWPGPFRRRRRSWPARPLGRSESKRCPGRPPTDRRLDQKHRVTERERETDRQRKDRGISWGQPKSDQRVTARHSMFSRPFYRGPKQNEWSTIWEVLQLLDIRCDGQAKSGLGAMVSWFLDGAYHALPVFLFGFINVLQRS